MSTSDADATERDSAGGADGQTTVSDASRTTGVIEAPEGEHDDADDADDADNADNADNADSESDADTGEDSTTEAGSGAGALPPPGRSTFAESCTAIGLLLLLALFFGAQPLQLLAELVGQQGGSQLAVVNNLVLGNGLLAALAAVFGVVALVTRGAKTASWVSWAATALVVVGVLFLVVSAVSFPMVPTEQAPMAPQMPQ